MNSTKKILVAAAILVAVGPPLRAGGTLKEARDTWLKGNYAEAQEIYTALLKGPKLRSQASIGLSKALESEGEYDKALSAIDVALKEAPKGLDLLARRAELLHYRGRWEEAEKTAQQVVEEKDDHFLARYVLAVIERDRGEVAKADDQLRWAGRTDTQRANEDKETAEPDELRLVGLAAAEYARYHHLVDQFDFLVNELLPDALKKDKPDGQAAYEPGRLYQEKH